jgi:hypothetical protein
MVKNANTVIFDILLGFGGSVFIYLWDCDWCRFVKELKVQYHTRTVTSAHQPLKTTATKCSKDSVHRSLSLVSSVLEHLLLLCMRIPVFL